MITKPTHKTVHCPQCGEQFEREIVWFHDREFQAERGCLCDACEEIRTTAVAAVTARQRHVQKWIARVPEDYHRADSLRVRPVFAPALSWAPEDGCRRLGLCGPPGTGKSMAAALCAKELMTPFRWTNGFAARAGYNAAVTGDGEAKARAAALWLRITETPLLILDDVDKGNFTEAWASALFNLLESRNSNCLPTIWTSNHAPGALGKKIAKCGDADLADAIERRLCGGALVIIAPKSKLESSTNPA